MIRLNTTIILSYEVSAPSTFMLNIQPVNNRHQTVLRESLAVDADIDPHTLTQTDSGDKRLLRFDASAGTVKVDYRATVELRHRFDTPAELRELPVAGLPDAVLPYLLASRYCESDKLMSFAWANFGSLEPGHARVQAIAQWVREHVTFAAGASQWTTSAADTFEQRRGVCRDFAHLMIAVCRALNVPARFVTGIDYGADPALGPPDFHAYVEVFLSNRWYLFDPTDISPTTGLLRIGTGRDAADVPFAHIFGPVRTGKPIVSIEALDDPAAGIEPPQRTALAVCTAEAAVGAEATGNAEPAYRAAMPRPPKLSDAIRLPYAPRAQSSLIMPHVAPTRAGL